MLQHTSKIAFGIYRIQKLNDRNGSPTTKNQFNLNAVGDLPTLLLKTLVKCDGYSNPNA